MQAAEDGTGAKPIDVGNGIICASFGSDGSWLSVGGPHPVHGFMELSALPPFDEAWRGDPAATRAFRGMMLLEERAVLRLEIGDAGLAGRISPDLHELCAPAWRGRIGPVEVRARAESGIEAVGQAAIRQAWRLDLVDPTASPPTVRIRAGGRLDRPALAEISELQPPRPTSARTRLEARGPRLAMRAPRLPAIATLDVTGVATGWALTDGDGEATLEVSWAAGERSVSIEIAVTLLTADELPRQAPVRASSRAARAVSVRPAPVRPRTTDAASNPTTDAEAVPDRIAKRAVAYVRGCTALRIAADERVILTDHRLLPLSWTRDAYFQALLLLVSDGPGDGDRVADHLRWLWRRNERPDGRWVRSHHANGRRKDVAFQADQQLYPVIELADFWRATGQLPRGVDWPSLVPAAWAAAQAEVDSELGLMATRENAADDPATAPYIAGSQIVLWYAARRLAELAAQVRVGLDQSELLEVAERVRAAFSRRLASKGRWAYATDASGRLVHYHDANDLPVALAPAWGFCGPDDPGWLATMRFAFSPANAGFWNGPMPGLGSSHTPGAWTLGDVQAWLYAILTADAPAASAALARLAAVATDDGMLPEAYSLGAEGRLDRIRHWFAWPGAAFGAFWVLEQRGQLVGRLAAAT